MKKITCAFLTLALIFSLAACANNSSQSGGVSSPATQPPTQTEAKTDATNTSSDKKVLVVYYSATGSTEAVAQTVAETAHADIFELVPTDPYTSGDLNWTDSNSRVNAEHNDESKRNIPLVKTTPDNWEQYDTVFIGYPIWWAIAAWPVNNFVTGNDFTGKTVIPFCTSASSGIGQSGELLAQMAGTGKWLDGERFSSNVSLDKVEDWVKNLNY